MNWLEIQSAVHTLLDTSKPAGVDVVKMPDFNDGKNQPYTNSRITVMIHDVTQGNSGEDRGRNRVISHQVAQQVSVMVQVVIEARSYQDASTGIFALEWYVRKTLLGYKWQEGFEPFTFINSQYAAHAEGSWKYTTRYETTGLILSQYDPAPDPPLVTVNNNYTPL